MSSDEEISVISISSDSAPSFVSDTESDDGSDFDGPIRFVKMFTKRDLRILYLPLWFVGAAKMYHPSGRRCMNFCVRFGEGRAREMLVRVNHRPDEKPIFHELAGDWKLFTKVNRMRAKRRYSLEFHRGGPQSWSYIQVDAA